MIFCILESHGWILPMDLTKYGTTAGVYFTHSYKQTLSWCRQTSHTSDFHHQQAVTPDVVTCTSHVTTSRFTSCDVTVTSSLWLAVRKWNLWHIVVSNQCDCISSILCCTGQLCTNHVHWCPKDEAYFNIHLLIASLHPEMFLLYR